MSGVKIRNGYSRINRINLNEDSTQLDTSSVIGAAAAGAVIRILKQADSMEDIGNISAITEHFNIKDSNKRKMEVVGREEVTTLTDGNGNETSTAAPKTVEMYVSQGWTLVRTEVRELYG